MSDFDRLMGDSLKAIRDDHVREIEAEIPAARQKIASKVRGRRFTFVIGGVAVAAAAVAVALFIAQSVPKIDRAEPIPPSGPPAVVARIDVPNVGDMEPGLGALWVAHSDGLVSIDPEASAVADESPVNADAIASDSEAVFAINSNNRSISRLPFGTDEAATSATMEGTPTAIAVSEEAVWVAAAVGPDGYSEITTYTPHLEVPGPSAVALRERVVSAMTHDGDALWMATSGSGAPGEPSRLAVPSSAGLELHRFYPGGEETVSGLSEAEGSAADIAVGEGAAWVLRHPTKTGGNTITRVDLETDEITERAVSFEDSIESIAVGEGYLWATTAPTGMDMPDDTRASLHRIDPTTLEPAGEPIEVAGPGSKLVVGYGYVWVGDPNSKQIVQIDPSTENSPDQDPSPTPDPENTEDTTPIEGQCQTFLPFLSTDGSLALGLGAGGQTDLPLRKQSPQALVHYEAEKGRTIDVIAGDTIWPPFDEERIDVMGGTGTLHAIEDGYAVTFSTGGCDFQLIAYGFDIEEVRDFVATLVLRGHAETSYDSFALWPESKPENGYATCLHTQEGQTSQAESGTTAAIFAIEVLGWDEVDLSANNEYRSEDGEATFNVRRDDLAEPPPTVTIRVREVALDCWAVTGVSTPVPPSEPTGLSVEKRGARLSVGFSLEQRGLDEAAATIRIPAEDGGVSMSAEDFRQKGRIEGVFRHLTEGGPASFLVLVEDRDGQVIGAIGMALPSGDFAAG